LRRQQQLFPGNLLVSPPSSLVQRITQQTQICAPAIARQTHDLRLAPVIVESQGVDLVEQPLAVDSQFAEKEGGGVEWSQELNSTFRAGEIELKVQLWCEPIHLSSNGVALVGTQRNTAIIENATVQERYRRLRGTEPENGLLILATGKAEAHRAVSVGFESSGIE
jgi:hypothetical protein